MLASLSWRSVSSRMSRSMSLLVSPAEVPQSCVFLDATWFMPNVKRDPIAEYRSRRLPGAQFWPVDEIASEHPMGLKHMLPNAKQFQQACSERGISRDSSVVIYDSHGLFSSPRTLFTFKAFGHERCAVLDGGLPRWLSEGRSTESGEPSMPSQTSYEVSHAANPESFVRDYEDITASSQAGQDLILDARPAGRFHGTDPEPRPGLSSGHMPNSLSLPFNRLLAPASKTNPPYQTLLPKEELRKVFTEVLGSEEELEKALKGQRKIVTTCGSGMTAAVIWLALQVLGANASLYDESWTGYAARKESIIEKTP